MCHNFCRQLYYYELKEYTMMYVRLHKRVLETGCIPFQQLGQPYNKYSVRQFVF